LLLVKRDYKELEILYSAFNERKIDELADIKSEMIALAMRHVETVHNDDNYLIFVTTIRLIPQDMYRYWNGRLVQQLKKQ